jgi:hypothetical protein
MAAPTWAVVDITFCDEITHPGLYRVTQDLSCRSCLQCLLIDASNVTIDLQGHNITGDGVTTGTGIAVPRNASVTNIEVRNGTVASFVVGINLEGATKARVERMRVVNNKTMRILAGGQSAVVSNMAARNGRTGIMVGIDIASGGSLVVDNVATENGGTGIVVDMGSVVRNNVVSFNGLTGMEVLCPSSVSDNAAFDNNKTRPGAGFLDFNFQGSGSAGGQNAPPQSR